MSQINEERRQRALSLLQLIEDIGNERLKLLAQLEDLDAQEKAARLEHNALQNLDVPISHLPDKIIAMIFKAGSDGMPRNPDFGALVSHVSHRWRTIALSMPSLWSRVKYIAGRSQMERINEYLSRSALSPVYIYIGQHSQAKLGPEILQSVADHIGHCRQLCITKGLGGYQRLFECTSRQPAPILRFLQMPGEYQGEVPLFASIAPQLRVLDLSSFELDMVQMPYYFRTIQAVTHLRIAQLDFGIPEIRKSFRHLLGALKSLSHLDLVPLECHTRLPRTPVPIEVPKLQYLKLGFSGLPSALNYTMKNIRAPSLTSLCLTELYNAEDALDDEIAQTHFPSLRHLTISFGGALSKVRLLFTAFPNIEHLTYEGSTNRMGGEIDDVLAAMNASRPPAWAKMQRIAASKINKKSLRVVQMHDVIVNLQQTGHLRKLMLPKEYLSRTEEETLVPLRKIVDIECFRDDWPTPFETEF